MTVKIFTYTNSAPRKHITGFAFVIDVEGHTKSKKGAYKEASKNMAEVYTMLNALSQIKNPCRLEIHTSDFVRAAINDWIPKWRDSGWKNSKGVPMEMEFITLASLLKPHKYSVKSDFNEYTNWLKQQAAEMERK